MSPQPLRAGFRRPWAAQSLPWRPVGRPERQNPSVRARVWQQNSLNRCTIHRKDRSLGALDFRDARRRRRQQWWWLSMDARARVRACIQQPIGCPRPLQHGRTWLCALEQQEHLLQQRTNARVGYARFGSNLPHVPSEQGTAAGAGRVVVLTWAGKDAPPGRAALRLDDHTARRSLLGRVSRRMYYPEFTILRVLGYFGWGGCCKPRRLGL